MKYCLECGNKLPQKAKFCNACGAEQEVAATEPIKTPSNPEPENKTKKTKADTLTSPGSVISLNLLQPGDTYKGYHIISLMNKDDEGVKYIANKNGDKYVLKVFFKSRLADLAKFHELQLKLNRIMEIDNPHIAKVVEISQAQEGAYMATRFVQGESLDKLKKRLDYQIEENLVRDIAIQLVQATMDIRQHGLSISKLILSGMMLDESGKLIILSSGIKYEDSDESDDVFVIGVLLAQLLCTHTLYKTIYNVDRLIDSKFQYINGVSQSFNKVVSGCLYVSQSQRFTKLSQVMAQLDKMIPVQEDKIWEDSDSPFLNQDEAKTEVPKPGRGVEWGFYALVLAVLAIIGLFLFTNLFSILFRGSDKPFTFTGIHAQDDSLKTHTNNVQDRKAADVTPSQTEYGALKSRPLPNAPISGSADSYTPLPATVSAREATAKANPIQEPMPANMVYIPAGSFGFGRLKENLNHNVTLGGFYISRTELTQRDWNKYMTPANVSTVGDNLPVDNISWINAIIYCNGRSKAENLEPAYIIDYSGNSPKVSLKPRANGWRLPTEAEWEMAAKAGALFDYSGSDDPNDVSWNRDNSPGQIRAGRGKSPNGFGIYDMSGNVAEWCWDWYDSNYTRTIQIFVDPTGPANGSQRVIRGGSVMNGEGRNLNILYREKGSPDRGIKYVGLRLVRSR